MIRTQPLRGWALLAFSISAALLSIFFVLRWFPLECEGLVQDDSTIFLYIGQQLQQGARLYSDVWDHKPPLIFWLNAAGLTLTGGRPQGVAILAAIALAVFIGVSWRTAWRHCGFRAASVSVLLTVFLLGTIARTPNSTEWFALPLQALSFALLARQVSADGLSWRFAMAQGLLCGALFMLRPNLIGAPITFLIVTTWSALRSKDLAGYFGKMLAFGAALLFTLSLFSLPFLLDGRFGSLLDASVLFNLKYSAQASLTRKLATIFYGIVFTSSFSVSFLALAGFLAQLFIGFSAKGNWSPVFVAASVLFAVESVLSGVSGKGYIHYFIPWMLPLMILMAFFWSVCFGSDPTVRHQSGGPALSPLHLAAAALLLVLGAFHVKESVSAMRKAAEPGRAADATLTKIVQAVTGAGDPVYVWWYAGAHGTPFRLQRRSASQLFHLTPILHDRAYYLSKVAPLLAELENTKPKIIIEFADKELPPLFFGRESGNVWAPREIASWDTPSLQAAKAHLGSQYRRVYFEESIRAILYLRNDLQPPLPRPGM